MVVDLENQINEYFDKPVDGKEFTSALGLSNGKIKEIKPDKDIVEISAGFGSVWLSYDVFFNAIKYFAGAKKVNWGKALERDNWTDGEIHKCLLIDGTPYEFRGNGYSKTEAKIFVKSFVEGKLRPYQ